ncbi:histidine kinase [Cohnella sp. WQ 127256]|uniref:sensor histidine kinase n=1 Tax=Cohnella sp. WQ 127256 TaxID=2938790 RepID=UPI002119A328|nr:histidine kinase [Cohnella sp. WQ 127256]
MKYWQSVRFKIVVGFFLVIVPMIAFIIYNNVYAMNVVRQQVSSNYNKLLTVNVRENDKMLLEFMYYLLRLRESDPDIALIRSLPAGADEITFAKIRLQKQFIGNSGGINNNIDSLFVYTKKEDDVFITTQNSGDSAMKRVVLLDWSREHMEEAVKGFYPNWESVIIEDMNYLLKYIDMGSDVYAGVLVRSDSLMRGLESYDVGPEGNAFLINKSGEMITKNSFAPMHDERFRKEVVAFSDSYGILKSGGKAYLVLSKPSANADVNYVIVTTESYILQNLPFFQKMLYVWIPLLVVLLLTLYLIFMQRVMFKPLVELIRGMRKLGQGRFEVRLPTNQSSEFSFMSGTFNQMVEQIESLKIGIYEEQIRVQRAEYKHLQIQINPHFYMNSLNIIYNLAALKDFKSVQKLSLHLADYFRFLMQSHRSVVPLTDEISHIKNYLEIHKLRYVTKLDYEINIEARHLTSEISPLMIQPFVENAIIHGFNHRVQDGSVFRVGIRSEDDSEAPDRYIRIIVEDNGSGFPPDMLRDLESNEYILGTGEQHLGIWNILRRFKMLYGDEGSIVFRNSPEGGAVVEIKLPLLLTNRIEMDKEEHIHTAATKENTDADDDGR